MTKQSHRVISPSRIFAIAGNTFTQLVRLKVFYFLVIFTILILCAGFLLIKFSEQQKLKMLKDISFGSMSIFSWIFAIASTSMLIPKDVEDRTLYTILAKPVPRTEYLFGKFLGVAMLIFVSFALMLAVSYLVITFKEHSMIANIEATMTKAGKRNEEIQPVINSIREQGFSAQLIGATYAIFLKACVVAMFTLLISSFSSSFIFTILVSFLVFFIGHFQPMLRDYWQSSKSMSVEIGHILSLAVAIIFPNLKRFDLTDQIISGVNLDVFAYLSITGLAIIYIAYYYLLSCVAFYKREF